MKKTRIAIYVLLLLGLLFGSASQSIGIQIVNAGEYGSGVFCPNNWKPLPPPNGAGDTAKELLLSQQACQYIHNYLDEHYDGFSFYCWGDIVPPNPPSDPRVYPSTYYSGLDALEYVNSKVTIFSKGHCVPWGNGRHYKLLCTDDPDAAPDATIWLHTNECKCHFDFIWHCGTARSYPVAPPYRDEYGPIGMPLCFTHRVDMDKYGSSGPAVYLGWNFASPQFETEIPENNVWQWAQYAVAIFYYMHYYGFRLWYALEYISYQVYGTSFIYSPPYNDLIVWGNMYMYLSY